MTSRSSPARVAVVVVNFNEVDLTRDCLHSVAGQRPAPEPIILVDNGSTDASTRALRAEFPDVVILRSDTNLGFAGGANLGLRHALERQCDWVWLLNNDTQCEEGALEELLTEAGSDERVGAVGSTLVCDDGSGRVEAYGGGTVSLFTGLSRHVRTPPRRGNLDFLSGASLLLSCRALAQVGLLDPGFFLYWEDVDLAFRLRGSGWRIAVAAGSRIRHVGAASTGFLGTAWDREFSRASVRFFRRHAPIPLVPIVSGALMRCLLRLRSGHHHNLPAVLAGVVQGLRETPPRDGEPATD